MSEVNGLNGPRVKTCLCGHTRSHPEVQQEPEYTLWGWIQLSMIGITPLPDRIVFRCMRCKKSLGVSRDSELLRRKRTPEAQRKADADDTDETG